MSNQINPGAGCTQLQISDKGIWGWEVGVGVGRKISVIGIGEGSLGSLKTQILNI